MVASSVPACATCGEPIDDQDVIVTFKDGERIHVRCWKPSVSAKQSDTVPQRAGSGLFMR
jgi:hypothetical protein